jgi:hypothetical protein
MRFRDISITYKEIYHLYLFFIICNRDFLIANKETYYSVSILYYLQQIPNNNGFLYCYNIQTIFSFWESHPVNFQSSQCTYIRRATHFKIRSCTSQSIRNEKLVVELSSVNCNTRTCFALSFKNILIYRSYVNI